MKKTKENYKSKEKISNPRDNFYTPRYAVELLIPYVPSSVDYVWECANGDGNISNILLEELGLSVVGTDLRDDEPKDFFEDSSIPFLFRETNSAIITNPPFGLKKEFFHRCLKFGKPFALLIPLDYSLWIIDAIRLYGAEKIIPDRRIDFITPFISDLVYKKELLLFLKKLGLKYKNFDSIPEEVLQDYGGDIPRYDKMNWKDIPEELITKHSSADFHSGWLTWGFGLGSSEVFVELSNDDKKRIF